MSSGGTSEPALPGSGIKKSSFGKKKKTKLAKKKLITGVDYLPTDRPPPPVLPSMNLAVRPDLELKSSTGVKLLKTKTVRPYHQANINDETTLQFIIRSRRDEWIRFNPDSLSLVVYGTYNNPNRNIAAAVGTEARAEKHALRSGESLPLLYLDPSVMGTSFFYKVDVSINNVSVPTNNCLGELFLQYVRCCRVYNKKPGPTFYKSTAVAFGGRADLTPAMKAATEPFDYVAWNRDTGSRVPVYLDGHFPFDCRNSTIESIDDRKEPNM